MGGEAQGHTMQWTFSDGLASVSLFVEPYDAQRKPREVLLALGATYTLTRRLTDKDGDWWLTAVGEVPPQTLDAFAQSLVRVPVSRRVDTPCRPRRSRAFADDVLVLVLSQRKKPMMFKIEGNTFRSCL